MLLAFANSPMFLPITACKSCFDIVVNQYTFLLVIIGKNDVAAG